MNLMTLLLDAAPQGAQKDSGMSMIIMLLAMIAIFYFLMIRPNQKRQKELTNMRNALRAGDAVITAGGIKGTVSNVLENEVIVKIAENVEISVDKNFITPANAQVSNTPAK